MKHHQTPESTRNVVLKIAGILLFILLLHATANKAWAQSYKNYYSTPNSKLHRNGVSIKPANFSTEVFYDPVSKQFIMQDKIGSLPLNKPVAMPMQQFIEYNMQQTKLQNIISRKQLNKATGGQYGALDKYLNPQITVGGEIFDRIFGGSTIDIKPQGAAELIFGLNISKVENPTLPERLQKNVNFDFDEKIQMGVTGQIGEKMKLGINYNTEATFDWENQTNISYQGNEDEIIQLIEAGNVSLPLSGTLITGSHSLFGLKTQLKFGKLDVTSVISQQKGESQVIEIESGAQTNDFEISVADYEANRHFFLGHFFKDTYDDALATLPIIQSGVTINRIEVWVTNRNSNVENARNIVAFADLGEATANISASAIISQIAGGSLPDNQLNNLYQLLNSTYSGIRDINQAMATLATLQPHLVSGRQYEKIDLARKLTQTEFSYNDKLGYISLNTTLNPDDVLAVAFEYSVNGQTYQVGEFSNDAIEAPKSLILKLLKPTSLTPQQPTWDLMMKNVYQIGAYQINSEDFNLNIFYQNDETGTANPYIKAGQIDGKLLLQVMRLDQLNSQLDQGADGLFDFIERITINSSNGRIFFPQREPFGQFLAQQINDDVMAQKYTFTALYDSTQNEAKQIAEKNKYFLQGTYKSASGSEILLNAMDIPEGSVKVTAGGMELTEGDDYLVDYTLGRVTILNQGLLQSGTPIKIALESNSLFNLVSKNMFGTHLNYNASDKLKLGATFMRLSEKPLTNKVNIGDEPISNSIWGLNGTYSTEIPFLTKLVDAIPFIETKEQSTLNISAEFAQLIPGHSKAIDDDNGVSYIDDFEGSQTAIDLKTQSAWTLASTPQGQPALFPEANLINDLAYGYNRAKLAWYNIISDFLRDNASTPAYLTDNDKSNHFVREVYEKEIFPNKESPNGYPPVLSVLNLAYYPNEKGPYNFDTNGRTGISTGINQQGYLNDPETRWGGIMRRIQTNDFEAANIENIEFWLMDPFIYEQDHTGGDFYINLGNVSEDILKDSRKSFENGLPNTATAELVDTTVWGRVPLVQSIINAFDNDPDAREFQDVGFDGLSTNDEQTFFVDYLQELANTYGTNSQAYRNAATDPSSDNYHFFRGTDYDAQQLSILDRYKNFNGPDGNSPTAEQSEEEYPTSATLVPDVEDINLDNTLSESVGYYQYKISLRPEDMQVGKNYITDVMEANVTLKNEKRAKVKWYQFKIPVYEPEQRIGEIEGFKSIRFMRMFMHGFQDTIIMRFAKMNLVRGDWRKYNYVLKEASETLTDPQVTESGFDVSAVNIEENGSKTPVNYVLPPGITRETDPTNPYQNQINEQSIMMRITNLADGDARAAYKNLNMDMRQYRKMRMFVHAEAYNNEILNNKDLTAFIRIGSDYKQNYYEYEIPLNVTNPGTYNDEIEGDRRKVWPDENVIEIDFEDFQRVKQARNNAMRTSGSTVSMTAPYYIYDGSKRISVNGNPNLSNIKTLMIGVRNPLRENNMNDDDGFAKTGEIWMNELRLTDFVEEGGWAANARVAAQFADFASITVSGNTSKPGFGSIEKKVNERQKEEIYQYDVASNFELGKFFPKKLGVSIPVYVGYSENISNPQYNPLDPDIPLEVSLNDPNISQAEKDSIKSISQDYLRRRSLNFTNVRIQPQKIGQTGNSNKIYSISNFTTSVGYNEIYAQNISTKFDLTQTYNASINYNYTLRPKNVTPLRNVKFLRSRYLALVRDINFYYAPSLLSFRTDMNRKYNEKQVRNIQNFDIEIPASYRKDFAWTRTYDLQYNLSRGIKTAFSASNIARVDEPDGRISRQEDDYMLKRDTIWDNIRALGRTTSYNHKISASFTLPTRKIPFLAWTSATARYEGTYTWDAGPITSDTIQLGNTIKNANKIQLNTQLNFQNLYSKSDYLKKVYQRMKGGGKNKKELKTVTYNKKDLNLKKDRAKTITHNLGSTDVSIEAYAPDGSPVKGIMKVLNENKISFTINTDQPNVSVTVSGQVEKNTSNLLQKSTDHLMFVLTGIKNVSLSYDQNGGTLLPGYLLKTQYLGMDFNSTLYAPGIPFVLGIQDENMPYRAANQYGWLTTDSLLNTPVLINNGNTINFRAMVEPLVDMRIDITAMRSYTQSISEFWIADETGIFTAGSTKLNGNFSMSYNMIGTAFDQIGNDYSSAVFDRFLDNRLKVANTLANQRATSSGAARHDYNPNNPNYAIETGQTLTDGYPNGYSALSQEVLIPAFLAAYAGKDVGLNTSPFPQLPQLNWRVNYSGLAKVKLVQKLFKTINLMHSYRSTYNVGGFESSPLYSYGELERDGFSFVKDQLSGMFIPQHLISNITLNEQFGPLAGIDLGWKFGLSSKFEYKKTRTISLSFANNQVMEMYSDELVLGLGYKFDKLPLNIKVGGKANKFESDLNIRGDLTIRDMMTVVRKIEEQVNQLTAGQKNVSLKLTADYMLNARFNLRLFYDQTLNTPKISTSFPTSNTKFGVSVRFSLIP